MLSYLIRGLAGSAIGYVFGLLTGGGLVAWSIISNITGPQTGAGIVGFLFILSFQSALIGGLSGLISAKSTGWDIVWRTVPSGSLVGLLLVVGLVAVLGGRTGPNGEYIVAAHPAKNVASMNMMWGALVGLIVGLCFMPFYRRISANQSPSPTSPNPEC